MKSVCTKYFSLGGRRSVVLGLELSANFENFISILSFKSETGERVRFSKDEITQFFKWFSIISDFFNKTIGNYGVRELSQNLEMLFTREKILVIRSKLNWNTMRLEKQNFDNLNCVKELITQKLQRLECKRLRADIIFNSIVQVGASSLANNWVPHTNQCMDSELNNFLNVCKSDPEKLQREVVIIFHDEILKCVIGLGYVSKPDMYPSKQGDQTQLSFSGTFPGRGGGGGPDPCRPSHTPVCF